MKAILCTTVVSVVLLASSYAQDAGEKAQPRNSAQAAAKTTPLSSKADSCGTQELRADLQRLKSLQNQMRTNLAFVQTTQTPLKHQFELETDAWQVIIEQMERRLKHMDDHGTQAESGR
jgi:tellurite resistance protein